MGRKFRKTCNNCWFVDLLYCDKPCIYCQQFDQWQEPKPEIIFDEFDAIEYDKQLRGER